MKGSKRSRPPAQLSSSQKAQLRRKWRRWTAALLRSCTDLMWRREIFLGLNEIGKSNKKIGSPGDFLDWIRSNYVIAIGIGIRRLTDPDSRSISLTRLLRELEENPGVISRAAHRALYRGHRPELADRTFDNLVGKGEQVLRPAVVREDRGKIASAEQRLRTFLNKTVAHRDQRVTGAAVPRPTYGELHASLDAIDRVLVKYHVLLTAEGYSTTRAEPQFDWRTVLLEPWIPLDSPLRPKRAP